MDTIPASKRRGVQGSYGGLGERGQGGVFVAGVATRAVTTTIPRRGRRSFSAREGSATTPEGGHI